MTALTVRARKHLAVPATVQTRGFTCAPACLLSLLLWENPGTRADEDKLVSGMRCGEAGADLADLVRMARRHGLEAAAVRYTADQLRQKIDRGVPVALALQAWGGTHMAVAVGWCEEGILVMDPALGGERGFVSWRDLAARWRAGAPVRSGWCVPVRCKVKDGASDVDVRCVLVGDEPPASWNPGDEDRDEARASASGARDPLVDPRAGDVFASDRSWGRVEVRVVRRGPGAEVWYQLVHVDHDRDESISGEIRLPLGSYRHSWAQEAIGSGGVYVVRKSSAQNPPRAWDVGVAAQIVVTGKSFVTGLSPWSAADELVASVLGGDGVKKFVNEAGGGRVVEVVQGTLRTTWIDVSSFSNPRDEEERDEESVLAREEAAGFLRRADDGQLRSYRSAQGQERRYEVRWLVDFLAEARATVVAEDEQGAREAATRLASLTSWWEDCVGTRRTCFGATFRVIEQPLPASGVRAPRPRS